MTTTETPVTLARVADELARARRVTLDLLAPVPDADQRRQVSPLMSPLCWDLAHIAHYEELWLLRALGDVGPTDPRFDDLYDAFRHPRRERVDLPILDPAGARAYAADVRARVLAHLDRRRPRDATSRSCATGSSTAWCVQHEHQHDETMLATLQLMGEDFAHPAAALADDDRPVGTPAGIDR